ncbi:zinc finger protein 239-like [Nematolebias whitei]|uniref:zinc finger protein 239-like n=1 Tax=Nematolebias whitei TaxID=451745 RepID=UPI001897D531|nr:zinc finger protein 239-like [Nematolebias whitei]
MSEFLNKTGPDHEEELSRLKEKMQQNKILDAVLNPRVLLHRLVVPADVHQTVLIKEEAPEEWSSGVDQKDTETLNIKEEEEELRISLDVEQLSVKEETDDTRFSFTAVPLTSEDDEEKPPSSQLHQHQVEDGDLPTSSSADQMKAATGGEDCGGSEISRLLEKSAADYEEKHSYLKEKEQQNQILDADFSDNVHHYKLVFPADVQQMMLIVAEGSEEWRSDVDQKDTELFHMKLHEHQVEDEYLPTSSSADQMNAATVGEDCGGAGTTRNSDLNTREGDSSSSATDVSEDDDEYVNDTESQIKDSSDSGSEPEDHDKDWKESRTPEWGVNTVNKSCSFSACDIQFLHKKSVQRNKTGHSRINSSCLVSEKCFRGKKPGDSNKNCQSRQKSSSCDDCGKKINRKAHLNIHMKIHTEQKPFACGVCGQRLGHKSTLKMHMRIHTGQKPFACDVCGQMFRQKPHLNMHMRIHTGQKPFTCDVCGHKFRDRSTLNGHMLIHTGHKQFACDVCGQRFGRKSTLNRHITIHTGQKPFACDVCGQRFGQKSHLNMHMRIHTGQKPFTCYVCGHNFRDKSTLKCHMIIHTGQKQFACDVCGRSFGRKSTLNRHMTIHTG